MDMSTQEIRESFKHARKILIKIGTEIVHSRDGLLAMGQIGGIVEQIAALHMQGKQIILVSSGSVAIGKMVLHRQYLLSGSMQSHLGGRVHCDNLQFCEKACAAAGQSGLQSLYEMLFAQYHLACSQILASDNDFQSVNVRQNLHQTVETLLEVGIIPVINENDVITQRTVPLSDRQAKIAWDNDSLASLFAQELDVDLMIMLTDIPGIYGTTKAKPSPRQAQLLDHFTPNHVGVVSKSSRVGPLGQKDKWLSCMRAVNSGRVKSAVVVKAEPQCLMEVLSGRQLGTLFSVRRTGPYTLDEQDATVTLRSRL